MHSWWTMAQRAAIIAATGNRVADCVPEKWKPDRKIEKGLSSKRGKCVGWEKLMKETLEMIFSQDT